MTGKIVRLVGDKGFGFIRGDNSETDYFFHRTGLKNCTFEDLGIGQEVEFEDSDGSKGPRAEDVFVS